MFFLICQFTGKAINCAFSNPPKKDEKAQGGGGLTKAEKSLAAQVSTHQKSRLAMAPRAVKVICIMQIACVGLL